MLPTDFQRLVRRLTLEICCYLFQVSRRATGGSVG